MLSDRAPAVPRAAVQSPAAAAPSHRSRRRAARAAATRRSHAPAAVIAAEARLPSETETEAPAALLKSQRKSPDHAIAPARRTRMKSPAAAPDLAPPRPPITLRSETTKAWRTKLRNHSPANTITILCPPNHPFELQNDNRRSASERDLRGHEKNRKLTLIPKLEFRQTAKLTLASGPNNFLSVVEPGVCSPFKKIIA